MQKLIESVENRESYPEKGNYQEYNRDMYFLKRVVKSIREIAKEINTEQLYYHLIIDFVTGTYMEGNFLERQSNIAARTISLVLSVEKLIKEDNYFWYYSLKLSYDNELRLEKYGNLIQEQRDRLIKRNKNLT